MKIANCHVKINEWSIILKNNVTPAEALLLRVIHGGNAKGEVIKDLEETGEIDHTDAQEIKRLRSKYQGKYIKSVFPGASPRLPETFTEALAAEVEDAPDESFEQQANSLAKKVESELKGE